MNKNKYQKKMEVILVYLLIVLSFSILSVSFVSAVSVVGSDYPINEVGDDRIPDICLPYDTELYSLNITDFQNINGWDKLLLKFKDVENDRNYAIFPGYHYFEDFCINITFFADYIILDSNDNDCYNPMHLGIDKGHGDGYDDSSHSFGVYVSENFESSHYCQHCSLDQECFEGYTCQQGFCIYGLPDHEPDVVSDLSHYYEMDENVGNYLTDLVGNYSAWISGDAIINNGDGVFNNAPFFDDDDYVDLNDHALMGVKNFTISVWYKTNSTERATVYTMDNNNLYTDCDVAGEQAIIWGNETHIFNIINSQVTNWACGNQYHHIVLRGTYPNQIEVFLDGQYLYTFGSDYYTATNLSRHALGVKMDKPERNFTGYIDEFGLWKTRLTNEEISGLYSAGSGDGNIDKIRDLNDVYLNTGEEKCYSSIMYFNDWWTTKARIYDDVNDRYFNVTMGNMFVSRTYNLSIDGSGILCLSSGRYTTENDIIFYGCDYNGTCVNTTFTMFTNGINNPDVELLHQFQYNYELNYLSDRLLIPMNYHFSFYDCINYSYWLYNSDEHFMCCKSNQSQWFFGGSEGVEFHFSCLNSGVDLWLNATGESYDYYHPVNVTAYNSHSEITDYFYLTTFLYSGPIRNDTAQQQAQDQGTFYDKEDIFVSYIMKNVFLRAMPDYRGVTKFKRIIYFIGFLMIFFVIILSIMVIARVQQGYGLAFMVILGISLLYFTMIKYFSFVIFVMYVAIMSFYIMRRFK